MLKRLALIVSLLLSALAGGSSALAQSGGTPAAPADAADATSPTAAMDPAAVTTGTLRMLRTLEAFHKDVKTVHATFHQVRVDETFMEPVESEGELYSIKPDRFRVDYTQAGQSPEITLILKQAIYNYTPRINQIDYWEFKDEAERKQQLHYMLIGFGLNTAELVSYYEIHSSEDEAGPLAKLKAAGGSPDKAVLFVFKPRPERLEGSPFTELELTVDKASHLPRKIWYHDQNDASVTLTMKTIRTDEELSDKLFDPALVFPKDAELINRRQNP